MCTSQRGNAQPCCLSLSPSAASLSLAPTPSSRPAAAHRLRRGCRPRSSGRPHVPLHHSILTSRPPPYSRSSRPPPPHRDSLPPGRHTADPDRIRNCPSTTRTIIVVTCDCDHFLRRRPDPGAGHRIPMSQPLREFCRKAEPHLLQRGGRPPAPKGGPTFRAWPGANMAEAGSSGGERGRGVDELRRRLVPLVPPEGSYRATSNQDFD